MYIYIFDILYIRLSIYIIYIYIIIICIYSITQLIITYIEFCHTCWHPILLGLRGCNKVVCGDDLERLTDMVPRLPKIPNFHTSGIKGLKRYTGNDRMIGKVTGLVDFMDFKLELCGLVSFTNHVSDRKIQDRVASTRCPGPYQDAWFSCNALKISRPGERKTEFCIQKGLFVQKTLVNWC